MYHGYFEVFPFLVSNQFCPTETFISCFTYCFLVLLIVLLLKEFFTIAVENDVEYIPSKMILGMICSTHCQNWQYWVNQCVIFELCKKLFLITKSNENTIQFVLLSTLLYLFHKFIIIINWLVIEVKTPKSAHFPRI